MVLGIGLMLGGCTPINKRAGIEVISYPTAKIFIDGKEAGTTPYKNSYLKPGVTEIKLVTTNREWRKTVELTNNINTVIDWEIGDSETFDGGYVLSMERTGDVQKAGLIVNSVPNEAAVAIDGEMKGFTPMRLEEIGENDKQITLSYPTHKSLNVFVKAIKGYRLLIDARLATENTPKVEIVAEPTAVLSSGLTEIMIKPTETGWLRVRGSADSAAAEVARVNPGEKYKLLEEKDGWYRIDKGWISAKYAEKL